MFRVHFENWNGSLPEAGAISVVTVRQPADEKQTFSFAPVIDSATQATFLQSVENIPEPHEFDAKLIISGTEGVLLHFHFLD